MKPLPSAAVVSLCLLGHAAVAQAQDAEAGEKVFRKCASCHKVGEGAGNGFGPTLNGLFGRVAGIQEGFGYSNTLREAGKAGLVWNAENLSDYIAGPKEFLKSYVDDPRPRMVFNLKDEQDRRDVIAYLQQFSPPVGSEDGEAADRDGAALMTPENKICVRNASSHSHFFAAEGKGVERLTATLLPGETLCARARGDGWSGVVSVYEAADGIEGCSRLVKTGSIEHLRKYVDFDRCFWSSNSPI